MLICIKHLDKNELMDRQTQGGGNTLNKDKLQNIYYQLVLTTPTTTSKSTKKGYQMQFSIRHGQQSKENLLA